MIRWLLLLLAVSGFGLGLLTRLRSPDWSPWQLGVLAGEFGHWLAAAVLAVGLAAWGWRGDSNLAGGVTLAFGLLGAGLLLTPAWQAARLAEELPAMLRAQFPRGNSPGEPFSPRTLFLGRDPEPVAPRTLAFADGLALDFYAAAGNGEGNGRAVPCVIVIHGGGWDGGDRAQLPKLNHWLARQGYAVAAVSYRLAPKFPWPAQRDDLLGAIAFLKSRADELGIDPHRLVLLGRSAGGQIAQVVGYTAGDAAIRGVVGLYAPSDLIFGYINTHENDMLRSPALMRQFLGGTPDSARLNYESASALFHVNRLTPPTLLLHGTNDAVVWYRHSVRLDARLAQHGIPRAFVQLPWATHAFDYNLHGPGGQLATYALAWFLADVTRK
jgi:acetyl esterase/lipase